MAWFFHVSPAEVLALPLQDFLVWERQAFRIADAQRRAVTGADDGDAGDG